MPRYFTSIIFKSLDFVNQIVFSSLPDEQSKEQNVLYFPCSCDPNLRELVFELG